MTVLGGARGLPAGALRLPGSRNANAGARRAPGARPVAAVERRRAAHRARPGSRAHHIRALIAGVIVLFLLGLIYLAQTKQLAAANFHIDQQIAQRDDLYRQVQTVETSVLRWGTEVTALERGQRLGLDILATKIRLADR